MKDGDVRSLRRLDSQVLPDMGQHDLADVVATGEPQQEAVKPILQGDAGGGHMTCERFPKLYVEIYHIIQNLDYSQHLDLKGEYSVRKRKPRVWGKNKLQPKKGEKGEEISPKDKGNFKQKIACFYVTSN